MSRPLSHTLGKRNTPHTPDPIARRPSPTIASTKRPGPDKTNASTRPATDNERPSAKNSQKRTLSIGCGPTEPEMIEPSGVAWILARRTAPKSFLPSASRRLISNASSHTVPRNGRRPRTLNAGTVGSGSTSSRSLRMREAGDSVVSSRHSWFIMTYRSNARRQRPGPRNRRLTWMPAREARSRSAERRGWGARRHATLLTGTQSPPQVLAGLTATYPTTPFSAARRSRAHAALRLL